MRRISIAVALVASAALALAGPASAKPGGHGPGSGHGHGHGRCATDHDTPSVETVAGHVDAANAALAAFNDAVTAGDDDAAKAAMRTYRRERRQAICETRKVNDGTPTIGSLETLGDLHVAALTTFDGAYEAASDELKRPLGRAIRGEKRGCSKVVRVLERISESATEEEQAEIEALVASYEAACDAVEVPEGAKRPGRPGNGSRPGNGGGA